MTLPASVATGTVTGLFLEVDGKPLNDGEVIFRPSTRRLLVADAPATLLPSVVVASTNVAGVLLGPDDQPGVVLVATDNASVNPLDWTWTVSLDFGGRQWGPQPYKFAFLLPSGTTVDLAAVTPVASSGGEPIIVGPPGPPGAGGSPSSLDLVALYEGSV